MVPLLLFIPIRQRVPPTSQQRTAETPAPVSQSAVQQRQQRQQDARLLSVGHAALISFYFIPFIFVFCFFK